MEKKTQKLQKILAALGLGSRREIEEWIVDGRVSVDGRVAKLGDRITGEEKIHVDRCLIDECSKVLETRVLMYNKPEGEVSTRHDPEKRPTVFDRLPKLERGRWVMVGRLDINTTGLMLFTTNGEVANRLMHPSGGFEREYAVRVLGKVTEQTIQNLLEGVDIAGGMAKFESVEDAGGEGANHWYRVVLKEGRNREVRRMWESQGVTVSKLKRIRFSKTWLPADLKPGKYIEFNQKNIQKMLHAVGAGAVLEEEAGMACEHCGKGKPNCVCHFK